MRRVSGAVAVAIVVLMVNCSALPHQEQEASASDFNSDSDINGEKTHNRDSVEKPHLARQIRSASLLPKPHGYSYNSPSDFGSFIGKKNFDEIDQTSMPFPKRYYHYYGPNARDYPLSNPILGNSKNMLRPFDEIDLSGFPIGSKRSDVNPNSMLRQFDEIDLSGFPIGSKRSSYIKPNHMSRPFDEIDLSGFPIGSKRSDNMLRQFDEIDLSGFPIGSK